MHLHWSFAAAPRLVRSAQYVVGGVLLGAMVSTPAFAADLDHVSVRNEKKRYFVDSRAILDAPLKAVYDTLIDFDEYEKVSSVYTEAHWINRNADDSGEIYTYTRGCIAFFCKGLARVETVTARPITYIETRVDPARSDAHHGVSIWTLEPQGERTVIHFVMEFEPTFWVPPLIGPFVIKNRLRHGGEDAIQRIEASARLRVAAAKRGTPPGLTEATPPAPPGLTEATPQAPPGLTEATTQAVPDN